MLKIDFSNFPELETDRLLLKEINLGDAYSLFKLRSNPEIMKYLDKPLPQTLNEIISFINIISQKRESGEGITWGISLKNNKLIKIGNIGFHHITKEHYRAEIGYMIETKFQRKGIMYEAMNCVLNYGFKNLGFHSIEANINPNNMASKNLLLKSGFSREAYFKENYYYNGKFLDSETFSIINPY